MTMPLISPVGDVAAWAPAMAWVRTKPNCTAAPARHPWSARCRSRSRPPAPRCRGRGHPRAWSSAPTGRSGRPRAPAGSPSRRSGSGPRFGIVIRPVLSLMQRRRSSGRGSAGCWRRRRSAGAIVALVEPLLLSSLAVCRWPAVQVDRAERVAVVVDADRAEDVGEVRGEAGQAGLGVHLVRRVDRRVVVEDLDAQRRQRQRRSGSSPRSPSGCRRRR